jgi:hypothetical protein
MLSLTENSTSQFITHVSSLTSANACQLPRTYSHARLVCLALSHTLRLSRTCAFKNFRSLNTSKRAVLPHSRTHPRNTSKRAVLPHSRTHPRKRTLYIPIDSPHAPPNYAKHKHILWACFAPYPAAHSHTRISSRPHSHTCVSLAFTCTRTCNNWGQLR